MGDGAVGGLFLVAVGLFPMAAAWFDWNFFMESRKARFMVRIMGRNGARGFYFLLGLAIAMMGLLAILGVLDFSYAPRHQ